MRTTQKILAELVSINSGLSGLIYAFLFGLGYVVAWGGAATLLGGDYSAYLEIVRKVAGAVVIVFGLASVGMVKIPWQYFDTRLAWQGRRRYGLISFGLIGVFFATGWTPSIGPTLGAILTSSSSQTAPGQTLLQTSFYPLGLCFLFLVVGIGMDRASKLVFPTQHYVRKVQFASGILLIIIGTMLLTNQLSLITNWVAWDNLFLDLPHSLATMPTFFIALLASLLTLLSPFVLPFAPAYFGYLGAHAFDGEARP